MPILLSGRYALRQETLLFFYYTNKSLHCKGKFFTAGRKPIDRGKKSIYNENNQAALAAK